MQIHYSTIAAGSNGDGKLAMDQLCISLHVLTVARSDLENSLRASGPYPKRLAPNIERLFNDFDASIVALKAIICDRGFSL